MEMINAIGRRKSAVARVYVTEGTGKITINKVELSKYFPSAILQYVVKQPLLALEATEKYDIKANLDGGGFTGQSQALRLAIARALVKINAARSAQGSSSLPVQQALIFGEWLRHLIIYAWLNQPQSLASKLARPKFDF